MINKACNKFKNDIIFIGDFNYLKIIRFNILNKDENNMAVKLRDRFVKNLKSNFFTQHILQLTRNRDNQSQNMLDLLITNGDIVNNIELHDPIGHSDHVVLKSIMH